MPFAHVLSKLVDTLKKVLIFYLQWLVCIAASWLTDQVGPMIESVALDFLLDAETITSEEKTRRHEAENYWRPSLSERC